MKTSSSIGRIKNNNIYVISCKGFFIWICDEEKKMEKLMMEWISQCDDLLLTHLYVLYDSSRPTRIVNKHVMNWFIARVGRTHVRYCTYDTVERIYFIITQQFGAIDRSDSLSCILCVLYYNILSLYIYTSVRKIKK